MSRPLRRSSVWCRFTFAVWLILPLLLFGVLLERRSWLPRTLHCDFQTTQLVFANRGNRLVAIGGYPKDDGSVAAHLQVWDTNSGAMVRHFADPQGYVTRYGISRDGATVAQATAQGSIKLWEATTGKSQGQLSRLAPNTDTDTLTFAPDGELLAESRTYGACSENNTPVACKAELILWDLNTHSIKHILARQRPLHEPTIQSVIFSPDGTLLAGADCDGCYVWDTATGRLLWKNAFMWRGYTDLSFAPDGKALVGGDLNKVCFQNATTGRSQHQINGFKERGDLAFTPDGRTLAVGDISDQTVSLFNVPSGRKLRQFSWGRSTPLLPPFVFSPDSDSLAFIDGDTVQLWDIATGRLMRRLSGHSESVTAAMFSPDSHTLAIASDDTIRLWRIQ